MILSTDKRQQNRNDHWSDSAQDYNEMWRAADPEAQLYKELEADLLIEFTQAAVGRELLDMCSGTGRNTLALAATGAHVVGLDGAPGMVEQAQKNAEENGAANVEFITGDSRDLPFEDNRFDAVVGTRFMYMMDAEEKRRIVSEACRVVRPGGIIVLHFNVGFWGLKHELVNLFHGRRPRLNNRYLWPGQAKRLFEGLQIEHMAGIKFPRLAMLGRVIGRKLTIKLNRATRRPGFRFLCGYMLVAARKESRVARESDAGPQS